jgi:hypothetical protein
MPQPLLRYRKNAPVILNNVGIYPLRHRPELARMAMEGIATFATVESWMLDLYLDLVGGNRSDAATLYLTLDSRSAKSAALEPFIKRLSQENRELYRALMKLMRTRAEARDKLAHWVWGFSPPLPDVLLLADPRAMSALNPLDHDSYHNNIWVYRETDFAEIIKANEELAGFGFLFRWIVTNHISNREGELYRRLCAEPALANILHRPDKPNPPQQEAGE